MTPKGVPVNGADVVVSPYPGTGESFENDAESSRRNVKVARLEPNAVHVRNPQLVVFQVGVGNEMVAASLGAVEAVGETRKGSNWHVSPQVRSGAGLAEIPFGSGIWNIHPSVFRSSIGEKSPLRAKSLNERKCLFTSTMPTVTISV